MNEQRARQGSSEAPAVAGASSKSHCGHEAVTFDGAPLHCYLPAGHKGWHEETFRLRDGALSRQNWGSDGLAMHASKDRP